MRRVAKERPINVNWKLLSLAAINSPDDWTKDPNAGHIDAAGLNRTLLLARRKAGNEAMDRLFVAYGNAIFGTQRAADVGPAREHIAAGRRGGRRLSGVAGEVSGDGRSAEKSV